MTRKTASIPVTGDVNIGPILPLVDTAVFQRLRLIKQLGMNLHVFPAASHTRFEHSLGTYALTLQRMKLWQERGRVSEEESTNVALYGLLHDIGHGPYSHALEPFGDDHNVRGRTIIAELAKEITACGGNPAAVVQLMNRQHPLAAVVNHHPLGTDKLDYLIRDAGCTNEAVALPVTALLGYACMLQSRLGVEQSIIHEALQANRAYLYMYHRVYFRRACLMLTRFLQKMVGYALDAGAVVQSRLATLTDNELDALLITSTAPALQWMRQRAEQRDFPKAAVAIYGENVRDRIHAPLKPIAVHSVDPLYLKRWAQWTKPTHWETVEQEISSLIHVAPELVLVLRPPSYEQLPSCETPVVAGSKYLGTIKDLYPFHAASLVEESAGHNVLYICVPSEHRERVASPGVSQGLVDFMCTINQY